MAYRSSVDIHTEWDIVAARQLGRNEAKKVGFGTVDQARITTAISELARNIYLYAGAGKIEIERLNEDGLFGVHSEVVHQTLDSRHPGAESPGSRVTVFHHFSYVGDARAFVGSDDGNSEQAIFVQAFDLNFSGSCI